MVRRLALSLTVAALAGMLASVPASASAPRHTQPALPASVAAAFAATATPEDYAAAAALQDLQAQLAALGLPVTPADDGLTWPGRRALCLWRELTGQTPSQALPAAGDADAVTATGRSDLRPTTRMRPGLNVSITCQTAVWLTSTRHIKAMFAVSTGTSDGDEFDTHLGVHTIRRVINGWRPSSSFPGAMLYRPLYFHGGQALHGSPADDIATYPNSAGCVRMYKRDMDTLWAHRFGTGSTVVTYGRWVRPKDAFTVPEMLALLDITDR